MVQAATFVVGFALYLTVIESADYGSLSHDPVRNVEFLIEHETTMYAWNFTIYTVFGIALVGLTLALYERFSSTSPLLAKGAAAFGFTWAGLVLAVGMVANVGAAVVIDLYETSPERGGDAWTSLYFVTEGLGGGNEMIGGLWLLFVAAGIRADSSLPRGLVYLGAVAGLAGVLSAAPEVREPMGSVFGLGLIVWCVWVGVSLFRAAAPAAAPATVVPARSTGSPPVESSPNRGLG